jgi:7-carboxy-7-deazaguanine synthase
MFGKNQIRQQEEGDGNHLSVVAIFATIQGEGPRAGQPAVFVRLGGCNLACKFCDTDFDEFKTIAIEDIIADVKSKKHKLVVITGGEPLRQPIGKLCEQLIAAGNIVQLETNGMLYQPLPEGVEIVCCPKTGTKLDERTEARITAYKYLVSSSREEYKVLPPITHNKPVYVQPIDEYDEAKTKENYDLAARIAMENGYNLSLQLHKILGIE